MLIDFINRKLAEVIAAPKEDRLEQIDARYTCKIPEGTRIKSREVTIHVVNDDREMIEQLREDNLAVVALLRMIGSKIDHGTLDSQWASKEIRKVMSLLNAPLPKTTKG